MTLTPVGTSRVIDALAVVVAIAIVIAIVMAVTVPSIPTVIAGAGTALFAMWVWNVTRDTRRRVAEDEADR